MRANLLIWVSLVAFLLLGNQIAGVKAFTNGQSASIVIGQKDFTSYSPSLSQSGLDSPNYAAFDPSGNMWVAAHGDNGFGTRVLEFKPPFTNGMNSSLVIGQRNFTSQSSQITRSTFGRCCPGGPTIVLFDSAGNMWIEDYARVLEFKPPFSNGMDASIVIGQKDFTSMHLRCARDGLGYASGAAFDSSGNLWVLDSTNNRVLEYEPPFGNGMNASLVLGQTGFSSCLPSGEARPLTQNGLDSSFGDMAIDPTGNIWVGDNFNSRILEFKPPFSNGMNASLVIGQKDFRTATNAPQGPGEPSYGWSTGFDSAGNLWFSYGSGSSDAVFELKPPFVDGETVSQSSLVIGAPSLNSPAWVDGQDGLNNPNKVSFDSSGNLWVADGGNNRILEFTCGNSCAAPTSTSPGSRASPPFGGLQLVAIGAAVAVIGAAVGVVLVRRRGKVITRIGTNVGANF